MAESAATQLEEKKQAFLASLLSLEGCGALEVNSTITARVLGLLSAPPLGPEASPNTVPREGILAPPNVHLTNPLFGIPPDVDLDTDQLGFFSNGNFTTMISNARI